MSARIPAIEAGGGGLPALLREISRMQGDHAAASYAVAVVERLHPAEADLRRLLDIVRVRTSNDQALSLLLDAVAAGYSPLSPAVRESFVETARGLKARAAIEHARSLLETRL